jgi:membrane protein YqaA with SNARE-associated domain
MIEIITAFMQKHKFITYLIRWQLSTIILAPCIWLLPYNILIKTIISNLIGGIIFWWFDKWLFQKDKRRSYNWIIK